MLDYKAAVFTTVFLLLYHVKGVPVVWVWENSSVVWVALSFPFMGPDCDAATLSATWEVWVSANMGVITVFLMRQLESIT